MTLPVGFLPPAASDVELAAHWLEDIYPGLGVSLRDELRELCDRLADFPDAYQPCLGECRRAVLHRFDYAVFYRHRSDRVQIIAVLHCRLDPAIAIQLAQSAH